MKSTLTFLEDAVIKKQLDGDLPLLFRLRRQLELCKVTRRELTGVGFFTTMAVPKEITRIAGLDIKFGDVVGEMPGLSSGAGFLLYVKNGVLDMLEGYSYAEPWPLSIDDFNLTYMGGNGEERNWPALEAAFRPK